MKRLALRGGAAASLMWAAPAAAHTSERSHVLLLPTELYVTGGALAVAASVLVVAALPVLGRRRAQVLEFRVAVPDWPRIAASLGSLTLLALLIAAGFFGPGSPLANPLPGFVWSLWWVGFTIVCLLFGNLWPLLNPWSGLAALAPWRAPLAYRARLGQWPAVAMLAGFAWLELVHPTPDDPPRLAVAVAAYLAANLAGVLTFGAEKWLGNAECFSTFFRMIGGLSPCRWKAEDGALRLTLGLPGHGLVRAPPLAPGEGAFVLMALATVSFDGFSQTFFWVAGLGLNPLEFPGRSAVVGANTVGLAAMFAILAAAFALATLRAAVPGLVRAVVPIAIAYHFAHYAAEFPVDALHALKALSDPFGGGLDLIGAAGLHPPVSIMADHATATFVFRVQVAAIVAGHVVAVVLAHVMALAAGLAAKPAVIALMPLNVLMVLYTAFGLWLLSSPTVS